MITNEDQVINDYTDLIVLLVKVWKLLMLLVYQSLALTRSAEDTYIISHVVGLQALARTADLTLPALYQGNVVSQVPAESIPTITFTKTLDY